MNKFLKKLRFFVIVIMAFWLCLEIFYRFVPNNYTVKHKNIQDKYKEIKTLILGNSHTFYGLNPEYFTSKTFNLANVSQTLFYDELLFKKHIGSLVNLKTVIIPVEYSSLSANENNPELLWRSYFYEAQMHIDTNTHGIFDLKKYSLTLSPPFSLTLKAIQKFAANDILADCDENGWGNYHGVNIDFNNAAMGKIVVAKHEDNSLDFSKNISRLNNIISTCKQKGIRVILITMPVTSHYAANVNNIKLEKIRQACDLLSNHSNVVYLNMFQDKHFNNKDFYDTDHLNSTGAQKCSSLVSTLISDRL